jgi:cobalt-zinc-cadmium efflux system membrane fusion protein
MSTTLLLVDDDEVLSQVLRRVLTRQGYNVIQAGSVAQGIEMGRAHHPQVGLLDLCLPDGDGMELAKRLHAEIGPIPLILMTAYPLRLRDHPELAEGFSRVLTKPLNLEELRQAIEKSLAEAPGQGAPLTTEHTELDEPTLHHVEHAGPHREPTTVPLSTHHPQVSGPSWGQRILILAVVGFVGALGLVVAAPSLGFKSIPGIPDFFHHTESKAAAQDLEPMVQLVKNQPDTLEVPPGVVKRLGIQTTEIGRTASPRTLQLSGSLAFDPNYLGSIQSRFNGEVIEIGMFEEPASSTNGGRSLRRPLRYGDPVKKGDLLAVVLSSALGEKKTEFVDALSQLQTDEETLKYLKTLAENGNTAEATVRMQQRAVVADRNAVNRAEWTLKTWQVTPAEIANLRQEAREVARRSGVHDPVKEEAWPKVEMRAPFDGVLVEKNITLHKMVDPTFDLFKVADMKQLAVYVHAYEEDLGALERLKAEMPLIPWEVRLPAEAGGQVLQSQGIDRIGYIVDPNQHTNLVMGMVDNRDGRLRAGQFVTASVQIPAPPGVLSVPTAGLVEDGAESIVFLQPDPKQPRYTMKRVRVVKRYQHMVHIRSPLDANDKARGLQELHPGDQIVTQGAVELKAALELAQGQAQAIAQK